MNFGLRDYANVDTHRAGSNGLLVRDSRNEQGGARSHSGARTSASRPANGPDPVRHASAGEGTLCTALANATKAFSGSAAGSAPSDLAAAFANLKANEPKVVQAAPQRLRSGFERCFGVLNSFYGTLASVGYDSTKLTRTQAARLAQSTSGMASATGSIRSYLAAHCPSTRPAG